MGNYIPNLSHDENVAREIGSCWMPNTMGRSHLFLYLLLHNYQNNAPIVRAVQRLHGEDVYRAPGIVRTIVTLYGY